MKNEGEKQMSNNYGKVIFKGKEFLLTSDASITGRQLQFCVNYNDAEIGENFQFEMSANAIDKDDKTFIVYWIFKDIKGEEGKEDLSDYDYDIVNNVEEA
jgi:hypothetical protein